MRILIVEDELMLSMALEDLLVNNGYLIAGVASRQEAALKLAAEVECDLAILDLNIKGVSAEPIAERIAARGIPIIFVTGYGTSGVPERFRHYMVVAKPYMDADMIRAVEIIAAKHRV